MNPEKSKENFFLEKELGDLKLVGGIVEKTLQSRVISADFEKVLDCLPFYVLLVDSDHNIQYANKALRAAQNLSLAEITGQYCPKLIHGTDKPFPGCPVEQAIKTGICEKEYFNKEIGRWLLTTAYPTGVKTAKGLDIYFHTVRDVTEEKNARLALQQSEKKYRGLFHQIQDIIFIMSPDGTLQDMNSSGIKFLQLDYHKDVSEINIYRDLNLIESDWEAFRKSLKKSGYATNYEVSFRQPDGQIVIVSINANLECDRRGNELVIRGIMRDLTRHRELEQQSTTDDLTGLYNHGFFQTFLVNKVRHSRSETETGLTVLFLDIDDFKIYNDTYGHQEGDYVLRKVAQSIMKAVRGEDVVSRYGGEEFTMILTCDFPTARSLAERIRETIEDLCSAFADERIKKSVTASIGLATLGRDADSAEQLVKIADARMYEAKKLGKNQVYCGEVTDDGDFVCHHHLL